MPVISTKRRRKEEVWARASSHGAACGLLGHEVSHPRALGARGVSSPCGTRELWLGRRARENFWVGLWEQEGFMHRSPLLSQPPRGDAVLFHMAMPPPQPRAAHRQAVSPGSSAALHAEWRPGPSPPCRRTGAVSLGPVPGRGPAPPVPLPGSLFLLFSRPRFRLLARRLHRTLLAHCVGPSADEAPGLLRHRCGWPCLASYPFLAVGVCAQILELPCVR